MTTEQLVSGCDAWRLYIDIYMRKRKGRRWRKNKIKGTYRIPTYLFFWAIFEILLGEIFAWRF
jgi:hypothetical protein